MVGSHALGCWAAYLEWGGRSQLVETGAQLLAQAVGGHGRESARLSEGGEGREDGEPGRPDEQHVEVHAEGDENLLELEVAWNRHMC